MCVHLQVIVRMEANDSIHSLCGMRCTHLVLIVHTFPLSGGSYIPVDAGQQVLGGVSRSHPLLVTCAHPNFSLLDFFLYTAFVCLGWGQRC